MVKLLNKNVVLFRKYYDVKHKSDRLRRNKYGNWSWPSKWKQ